MSKEEGGRRKEEGGKGGEGGRERRKEEEGGGRRKEEEEVTGYETYLCRMGLGLGLQYVHSSRALLFSPLSSSCFLAICLAPGRCCGCYLYRYFM